MRRLLHSMGYRFRLHRDDLPGKPDIILVRKRIAVFVHGCFWHGHSCRRGRRPSTNKEFWDPKLTRNKQRDRNVMRRLRREGWRPIVVWECETKDFVALEVRLKNELM